MSEKKDLISEVERLIDELESFAEKSPWFLPNKIVIRDEDFFRITQRIRELLPTELAEARGMLEKRDLILKNAQEEHRRILETAERRLEDLTSEEQVVILAKQQAERIVERARSDAEEVRRDALNYTAELLADMDQQFDQTLQAIRKGRDFLQTEISKQMGENLAQVAEGAGGASQPPAEGR